MRELMNELKALARAGQYGSPRFNEVLASIGSLWAAMTPEEQEALIASEPDLIDTERHQVEPEVVVCDLPTWLTTGPELVRRTPTLKTVDLIDQQPSRALGCWSWFGTGLPSEIIAHLPAEQYTTEKQALEGLSMACLRWARTNQEARYTPSQN